MDTDTELSVIVQMSEELESIQVFDIGDGGDTALL